MAVMIAVLLFVNAAFNILAWPTFFRRVARDPRARDAAGAPTRFFAVHAILLGVAMLLAALSVAVGVLSLLILGL